MQCMLAMLQLHIDCIKKREEQYIDQQTLTHTACIHSVNKIKPCSICHTVGMEKLLPCEVRTSRASSEVAANVERSCCERRAKLKLR